MKSIRPREMFRYWTSRLALAAMLALVVMPTAGRLYAGATGAAIAHADAAVTGSHDGHAEHADHAGHAGDATSDAPAPAPGEGHAGHADCPYCPLLGQLAGTAHPRPLIAVAPAGPAPALSVAAGHAARRPHGLHARGPPPAA
jgi:hypothetical protein